VGLCWTSCSLAPFLDPLSYSYSPSAPEALLLCGCQTVSGMDAELLVGGSQPSWKAGVGQAQPEPHVPSHICRAAMLTAGCAQLQTGGSWLCHTRLKFGTPQLRNQARHCCFSALLTLLTSAPLQPLTRCQATHYCPRSCGSNQRTERCPPGALPEAAFCRGTPAPDGSRH